MQGGGRVWVSVTPSEYPQNALFFKISLGACQTPILPDGRPVTPPPFVLVWIRPCRPGLEQIKHQIHDKDTKIFKHYNSDIEGSNLGLPHKTMFKACFFV